MHESLQNILNLIEQSGALTAGQKQDLADWVKQIDKAMAITEFKLDRTEKVKRTTAILLEETIEELEQKRKAVEAQNRELEVEAALENVRSRSLAMHSANELGEVVTVIVEKLTDLGVVLDANGVVLCTYFPDSKDVLHWIVSPGVNMAGSYLLPYFDHPIFNAAWQSKLNGEAYFSKAFSVEEKNSFFEHAFAHSDYRHFPEEFKQWIFQNDQHILSFAWQKNSAILIPSHTGVVPSADDVAILKRFAKVFEQAYTRFLDLQKAEAQAREAQIEAALERTRTQSMLMQRSDELNDTVAVFHQQLQLLDIDSEFSYIWLPDEEKGNHLFWATWTEEENDKIIPKNRAVTYLLDKTEPSIAACYVAWESGEPIHVNPVSSSEVENYFATWSELLHGIEKFKPEHFTEGLYYVDAYMKYGCFGIVLRRSLTEDEKKILARFTIEFERTYTRFLDLQKAEAQAREAQIELSLERIRAQVTAMQESADLLDIVVTMRTEFVNLGHEAHYFWHMRWLPDRYEKAMTSGDGSRIGMVMSLPRHIHGDIEPVADWEKSDEPTYVLAMDMDMAVDYVEKMITLGDFEQVDPQAPSLDDVRHIGGLTFIMARTTHGEIGYSLPGVVPDPPKDAVDTLVRFASVFDLAYKRFEDLQKAEARAREAVQQASLDRVRAEIASMRSPDDLQRITPLIWRELTTLGVPFFRCGVFIIDEVTELTHAYLSTPSGEAFAALHMKFDSAPFIHAAVEHWRQQQVYREEWNREQFLAWTQSILKQGLIDSPEKYQAGGEAPEKLVLHFVPFTQGMLYIGSSSALSNDEIVIGQALANAFGVAYARYEDFQRLETAKAQIEAALENLKKTQGQLVQAEKMASLGQLTAGIAHEIKNPLNFVNNFAALSVDLAKELREELIKRKTKNVNGDDFADVDELLDMLEQNAEKINHHGKRADGIVHAMMQHARGGKGERQPTDVNKLVEEYVNLSYHGMRAKIPDFNVTIEQDFGELDGKIEMVPQDIGRVLLNLLSNAFDAVHEKKQSGDGAYSPSVTVSTRAVEGAVEIRVRDNGNGIPDEVREKIFEPFFTTKPTGSGTGLGLSLSFDIVTQGHGGTLNAESTPGEGATFVVTLPVKGSATL